MSARIEYQTHANLDLELPVPQLATMAVADHEDCDTLWNRVLRICDQYAVGSRNQCPA